MNPAFPTVSRARSATSAPKARFVGVEKTYDGQTRVIPRLDLDVLDGEFLTLLGPSGSGKTTCLMMLAGFEIPTAGEILLDGRPVTHVPPHRRNIGMVFQNYALFPHLTVAQNLAFPLEVRAVARAEITQRVERALAMVELAGFGRRRPAQLSGGQQQRVALARALVFQPSLVLMDEPLGALDKQLREQMQYEIKRIHTETGLTVVYVTHDQSEALTMSDRIAVFRRGSIEQLDTPAALYESPRTAFVAQFIGENNRIAARVERIEGERCLVATVGGAALWATLAAPLRVGAATELSVRPERILLEPDPMPDLTTFPARVRDVVYHGDHLRVRLHIPELGDLVAKLPNDSRRATAPGVTLGAGWNMRDCRALEPIPPGTAETAPDIEENPA